MQYFWEVQTVAFLLRMCRLSLASKFVHIYSNPPLSTRNIAEKNPMIIHKFIDFNVDIGVIYTQQLLGATMQRIVLKSVELQ